MASSLFLIVALALAQLPPTDPWHLRWAPKTRAWVMLNGVPTLFRRPRAMAPTGHKAAYQTHGRYFGTAAPWFFGRADGLFGPDDDE